MSEPILQIENFLDDMTCRRLRVAYDTAVLTGNLPKPKEKTNDISLHRLAVAFANEAPINLRNFRDLVMQKLATYFGLVGLLPEYSAYTRVNVGGQHGLHADAFLLSGKPNHTPHRVCTAIIYLGTCGVDFEGGQLAFPVRHVEVVPKPGRFCGFECTVENQHLVRRVSKGQRDALTFWFTRDPKKAEYWPADAAPPPPPPRRIALPRCVHLGGETGETRPCPTCEGTVNVPLLACAVHGTCTIDKLVTQVSCCRICPDNKPVQD